MSLGGGGLGLGSTSVTTFDDDDTALLFEIFGFPQTGAAFITPDMISIYGPAGENYDFLAVVTDFSDKLNACNSSQVSRVTTKLERWEVIGSDSVLQINTSADGTKGTIVDYAQERRNIRMSISKIIGFECPVDGFLTKPPSRGQGFMR